MIKDSDRKKRLGIVYSTNPDFIFQTNQAEEQESLKPSLQTLRIQSSTKHRKGKTVTLITGFIGNEEELKSLEKELKTRCATGGSSKDNEIIIQGDFRKKAEQILIFMGYNVKLN
jgi:translation initiation factor 1